MIVKLVWPDCSLINDEYGELTIDSFWVECTPEEVLKIKPYITVQPEDVKMMPIQGAINDDEIAMYCYLVARDLKSVIPMPWSFPYSGQWNAWCPFRELPTLIKIQNLEELSVVVIPSEFRNELVTEST